MGNACCVRDGSGLLKCPLAYLTLMNRSLYSINEMLDALGSGVAQVKNLCVFRTAPNFPSTAL